MHDKLNDAVEMINSSFSCEVSEGGGEMRMDLMAFDLIVRVCVCVKASSTQEMMKDFVLSRHLSFSLFLNTFTNLF